MLAESLASMARRDNASVRCSSTGQSKNRWLANSMSYQTLRKEGGRGCWGMATRAKWVGKDIEDRKTLSVHAPSPVTSKQKGTSGGLPRHTVVPLRDSSGR